MEFPREDEKEALDCRQVLTSPFLGIGSGAGTTSLWAHTKAGKQELRKRIQPCRVSCGHPRHGHLT